MTKRTIAVEVKKSANYQSYMASISEEIECSDQEMVERIDVLRGYCRNAVEAEIRKDAERLNK